MCTLVSKQDRQRERKRVKRMSEVMLCSPFPHFPPSHGALPEHANRVVTNPILNRGTEKNSQIKSEPNRKQYFQAYTKMEPFGTVRNCKPAK